MTTTKQNDNQNQNETLTPAQRAWVTRPMKPSPDQFIPTVPRDLIGQSGTLAAATLKHVLKIKQQSGASLKLCFYGPPGCGKTTLANMAAATLAAHKLEIESINGRDLTIDTVRDWQRNACYGSLFGGWRVKIINEMDLVPLAAQDLLLSYLDTLPAGVAIIGTSNETRDTLSERFCSRFQQIKVNPPDSDEVSAWLQSRWNLPAKPAQWIALASCGNVRAALLQAAGWLTFGVLPEQRETKPVKCAGRSEAALRAWETMRARKAVAL
jgi:replication-associated recombination protein RarA